MIFVLSLKDKRTRQLNLFALEPAPGKHFHLRFKLVMMKEPKTIFVSLAGVGGCSVSKALRSLGQNALPFDWLIARQDFIISAVESDGQSFFDFSNPERLHGQTIITMPDNSALSIHDFKKNWALEKEDVQKKYQRRWMRFHDILNSRQTTQAPRKIIFVRSFLDMDEPIESIYDDIFVRREENIQLWEDFIRRLQKKNPDIVMDILIVTSRKDVKSDMPNVHVVTLKNYKDYKEIRKAIKKLMPVADRLSYSAVNFKFALKKFYRKNISRFFRKSTAGTNGSGRSSHPS